MMDPTTDPTTETPRLFTLDEANALLPRVRELAESLQARAARLDALQAQLGALRAQKHRGEHPVQGESRLVQEVLGETARIGVEMRGEIEALLALGCELKDVRTGLVDFRTRRDDRTVYLCWRLGEGDIRYWHELDTGFAGRQPL
jgi:hypothetical protein